MILHRLDGCAPTPLAYYLKAIGVLRLVAEQLDPEARGWWEGERFFLASQKDESELVAFFLEQYEPTPLVAPWNKGSGFFNESDPALSRVEQSSASRFELLRQGILAARAQIDPIAAADQRVRAIKAMANDKSLSGPQREIFRKSDDYRKSLADAESQFKRLKTELIPNLRLAWRGSHREWLDAALVLDGDGVARFPALLGTGGNDGRLDFTNNFFQRLNDLFDFGDAAGRPREASDHRLREALFDQPSRVLSAGLAVGQFAPGSAGGANMGSGPDGKSQLNPANFVLMLEGAILFTSAATRRLEAHSSSRASAPFAVLGRAAGYASAASSDESARGEQWMPLWTNPITLSELKRLLAEGRAQLGARGVTEPLDLARAIARLGTARGIRAFQRFGYIERNGQANLAVPLGRFTIPGRPSEKASCLDDLEAWLPRLRRQARALEAPGRLVHVERRLAEALFAVTQCPEDSRCWQSVLMCLSDVEAVQARGAGYQAGPIPRLRPDWFGAADDGRSPELRLALSLALQSSASQRDGRQVNHGDVRRHWLTLERGRFVTGGNGGQQRLAPSTERVMEGRSGVDDSIALVKRRLVEGARRGERRLPLFAGYRAAAVPADLARLMGGEVDLDRTLCLARALMALDSTAWAKQRLLSASLQVHEVPDDGWLAIRLALLPFPLPGGRSIGADPAIFRRLESGDAASAVVLSLRRLRAAGVRATIRIANVPPKVARLWAAALAFPITPMVAAAFVRRLDLNSKKESA